ncbi:TetR family transcriptional regulator [Nocardiopsis gilva YIM 90087]|uniref:TetR family transcriptional regulator n=1 Tax=Nocardiopsis gilva YIM 90087 TaxID=1235441 RepID=A0A223S2E1_9ACTN|nr:TetR family transcriptional regulator [Nocardiopsis gilva]ASU82295.1 TetR family transcriptional regulator [Nocardiopsis gilva YIM 90087]
MPRPDATATGSTPRRRDPKRRIAEIIAATERVIAARGVEGLTHRAVAEEAGVPLGATTYHFATKDDLLHAALQSAVERYGAYLDEWVSLRPELSAEQLAVLLADALMKCFGPWRDQQTVELEVYLAALHRPALRPIVDRYTELTTRALANYTDPLTARAAAAASTGITLGGLAGTAAPTRGEVEDMLRRVLLPNPDLPAPGQQDSTEKTE